MKALPLFRPLIAVYVRRELGRTLLTAAGVALGTALLVAIRLSIDSSAASFKETLGAISGSANIEIRAAAGGLDPKLVALAGTVEGVAAVSPLIEGSAIFPATDASTTRSLIVLGVDLLRAGEPEGGEVRDFALTLAPGGDFISFLGDAQAAVFTARFAKEAGMALGDAIQLLVDGRPRAMKVAALVEGGALADAQDGGIMLVDIGIADVLLGRGGRIDRIDIAADDKTEPSIVMERLRAALPAGAIVERAGQRGLEADAMLAAFRADLQALGYLSLLVGAFLIYNTMSIAVVRRAEAIGTLRAIGASRGAVRTAFIAEGALFGLTGGLAGLGLGILLARAMLGTVGDAISINFMQVDPTKVALDPAFLTFALVLSTAVAAAAAWGPANRAAATPPSNTMRRGAFSERPRSALRAVAVGACALAVCAGICGATLSRLNDAENPAGQTIPWGGYCAAFFAVAAFMAWTRPVFMIVVRVARRPLAVCFGAEGLIASSAARGGISRSGVAIAGLLCALGMTIATSVMVNGFRETVVDWMQQVLRADLYVTTRPADGAAASGSMPMELAGRLAAIPGVEAVDPFGMLTATVLGRPTMIGGGRFDIVRYAEGMRIVDGRLGNDVFRAAHERGSVVVSESFSRRTGLGAGDMATIPAASGPVDFAIEGVYFDYSAAQGYIIMDRPLYDRHFPGAGMESAAIYLAPGANADGVRRGIADALAEFPRLPRTQLRASAEIRAFAIGAFDRTFRITWIIELIAMVISVLGVANALLSQIIDRREEIIALRTIGMARGRIARAAAIESGLIGATGTMLGIGAGLVLSWIVAKIIMLQSFGWTLAWNASLEAIAGPCAAVFVAAVLAGYFSARNTGRILRTE